jgi:hypothetical protein
MRAVSQFEDSKVFPESPSKPIERVYCMFESFAEVMHSIRFTQNMDNLHSQRLWQLVVSEDVWNISALPFLPFPKGINNGHEADSSLSTVVGEHRKNAALVIAFARDRKIVQSFLCARGSR